MKGAALSKPIFLFFAILFFVIMMVFLIASFNITPTEINTASKEIVAVDILHRLTSSDACLSTGEAGILDAVKLQDAVNGGREHSCAYVPNAGYHVHVTDLRTDDEWAFGYDTPDDSIETKHAVAIQYNDGSVNPGELTFAYSYRDADLLLFITGQASQTFYRGDNYDNRRKAEFTIGKRETFSRNGVYNEVSTLCMTRQDEEERCKDLPAGVRVIVDGVLPAYPSVLEQTKNKIITWREGDVVHVVVCGVTSCGTYG
ncbi:MAG: hypothetical protein HYS81_00770 [Candidatus Aenigmatarchaeota archaeon]|nr:MAG: hypothetical protein HYS81_00770 [Candidatus Aenigmarchaeota archaeon]